jgi:hypothetical protein
LGWNGRIGQCFGQGYRVGNASLGGLGRDKTRQLLQYFEVTVAKRSRDIREYFEDAQH